MHVAAANQGQQSGILYASHWPDWRVCRHSSVRDLGASHLRAKGILDPYREAGVGGRVGGFGVDNFSAVIGELDGFSKADLRKCGGVRTDARVGGEHAGYVRPDPTFISAGRRSDDGG